VGFLGGKPTDVRDHYREADPMDLRITQARQWLLHGADDDTVPPAFSRDYVEHKKKNGEHVELIEIAHAGHYDLIDPRSEAFKKVKIAVLSALG
jgi:pimeloyl-ACP methyl ester carboxylesterase